MKKDEVKNSSKKILDDNLENTGMNEDSKDKNSKQSEETTDNQTVVAETTSNLSMLEEPIFADLLEKTNEEKKVTFRASIKKLMIGIYEPLRELFTGPLKYIGDIFRAIYSIFSILFINLYKLIKNIVVGITNLFNSVFQHIIYVNIDGLDRKEAAKVIRKKMLLSIVMFSLFVISIAITYIPYNLFINTLIIPSLILILFLYSLHFALIFNITRAGEKFFKIVEREDYRFDFSYEKNEWGKQLIYVPFIIIFSLVLYILELPQTKEYWIQFQQYVNDITFFNQLFVLFEQNITGDVITKSSSLLLLFTLFLFVNNYLFATLYYFKRFATLYLAIGKYAKGTEPKPNKGRRPTLVPFVLASIISVLSFTVFIVTKSWL